MESKDLKNLEWLAGEWEGTQAQGIYHEEWENVSEIEIKGKAYSVNKGQISNIEKLRIHISGDKIFYVADVVHNPGPVSFEMTYSDNSKFIFENPLHDFPKKITYEKKENELLAIIEATENGKVKKFEFDLKRIQ